MPQEAKLSLNEKSFILTALREGIRLDGRPLDAYRDVELSFGQEYGAVDVKLGKTRYVHINKPLNNTKLYQGRCEDFMRSGSAVPRPEIRRHIHHHH
jgi:hypothetical protein